MFKRSYFDICISFFLFEEKMNQPTEVVSNDIAFVIEKGFLESSEEAVCMKPFRDHPKDLVANKER